MSENDTNRQPEKTIGSIIKSEFLKSGFSADEFADLIACKRDNVYDIFKRERMDTDLLLRISKALNVNFFQWYSDQIENKGSVRIQLKVDIPAEEIMKIYKYCEGNKKKIR
jgi:predicted DNA-binding protein YlxM (UPF0122 family)